jgi:hypothetical protein
MRPSMFATVSSRRFRVHADAMHPVCPATRRVADALSRRGEGFHGEMPRDGVTRRAFRSQRRRRRRADAEKGAKRARGGESFAPGGTARAAPTGLTRHATRASRSSPDDVSGVRVLQFVLHDGRFARRAHHER